MDRTLKHGDKVFVYVFNVYKGISTVKNISQDVQFPVMVENTTFGLKESECIKLTPLLLTAIKKYETTEV